MPQISAFFRRRLFENGHLSPVALLYGFCAALIFVLYTIYLISVLSAGAPSTAWVSVLVMALTLLPILFQPYLKEKLGRFYRGLRLLFLCGMLFYLLSFGLLSLYLLQTENRDLPLEDRGKETVVLVFGCGSDGEKPGGMLQERLNTAAKLLKQHPEAVCIVSGARGEGQSIAEAVIMKKDLIENKAIDANHILTEEKGADTVGNIRESLKLMEEEGYSLTDTQILCVSSRFHLARVALTAEAFGAEKNLYLYGADTEDPAILIVALVREYMAYWKLFLFQELP